MKKKQLMKSVLTNRIITEVEVLGRHLETLKLIRENEPIGIIRLAYRLGTPYHKVRYTLRILEEEGLISPTPNGAITTKKVHLYLPKLKHTLNATIKAMAAIRDSI